MKDKINVAELLKDCPKGMELDCTIYEDVYFDYVDELDIIHCYIQHETYKTSITFNQHGTYNSDIKSKCIIFPKGKTTWEGFHRPFKDGDIAVSDKGDIHLLRTKDSSYCAYRVLWRGLAQFDKTITTSIRVERLATEEEKQKLFDAIKANGYRWNEETKTLEKLIQLKFKAGDRIRRKNSNEEYIIISINDDIYYYRLNEHCTGSLGIQLQDEYELVPNKFDINTLVAFDSRVLIRDTESQKWSPAIWGFYDSDHQDYQYKLVGCIARYCIPYEGNEHLLGTTDDCDEYFKTWK